jgi:hypothetical protein
MGMETTIGPTTLVTGYFNGNKYDLNFNAAVLGINVTLGKGAFLKDRQGRKINDPRLDEYVIPGCLSKELGETPVEIVGLIVPQIIIEGVPQTGKPNVGVFPVHADYRKPVLPKGFAKQNEMTTPEPMSPPQAVLDNVARTAQATSNPGGSSVKAYTVEYAKSHGIIPSQQFPRMRPGGIPQTSLATPEVQKAPPAPPTPVPAIPPEALAEPVLEAAPAPAREVAIQGRFICRADGAKFAYRSELKKYVRRKYPDQMRQLVDDLYPAPAPKAEPAPAP